MDEYPAVPNEACLLPDWICSSSDVVDDLLNLWVEILCFLFEPRC